MTPEVAALLRHLWRLAWCYVVVFAVAEVLIVQASAARLVVVR